MSDPVELETRPERLWREWLEARQRAMESNKIGDGVAAGRAWARWLAEFEVMTGTAR